MAKNGIEQEAQQHVIELPSYLRNSTRANTIKATKIGETIKLLGRDKALSYVKDEFEREFGSLIKFKSQVSVYLKKCGLRLRVVEDNGSIIVFANEIQKRSS